MFCVIEDVQIDRYLLDRFSLSVALVLFSAAIDCASHATLSTGQALRLHHCCRLCWHRGRWNQLYCWRVRHSEWGLFAVACPWKMVSAYVIINVSLVGFRLNVGIVSFAVEAVFLNFFAWWYKVQPWELYPLILIMVTLVILWGNMDVKTVKRTVVLSQ